MKASPRAWPDQARRTGARSRRGAHATAAGLRRLSVLAAGGLLTVCVARASLAAAMDESKLPPPAPVKIDFAQDIKPILTNNCYKCHSGERPKSHFLLTSRDTALKGGNQGVDIIPEQSAKSPLILYVSRLVPDMEMPPEGKGTPLTTEQIRLLRAWIDQGVVWEPAQPEEATEFAASPTVGWTTVSGDNKEFRELYWQREGWNGGVEGLELTERPGSDSKITAGGHMLLYDYMLTLTAEKNDLGFTQFGWSQYRKYFDDNGGYYPSFSPPIFDLNQGLHLDIGRAWANFGLTLPQWPRMVFGYEYQYEQGSKSTTQWGPVSDGTQTRNIYPAFEDISEHTHILKFDLDHEADNTRITDSFRGEWHSLATSQQNDAFDQLGAGGIALTTADEKQTHFQGANTVHLEKQFTDWLFASGGYLYSQFNGDAAVDVATINPAFLALSPTPAPGWNAQGIEQERDSHVFSVSALLGPWEGLTLSLGTQNEWTRQRGFGSASVNVAVSFPPFSVPVAPEVFQSDFDRSMFSQDVGIRCTKIPFTTLFVDGRLQQEAIGQSSEETGGLTPYLLETDATSTLEDLRAGFNTSPWRRVSLSGQYRYYNDRSDYNNSTKESFDQPYEGYPGFILWRDLLTQEAEMKLSLQLAPWLKTSLSYQWLSTDYRTATGPVADPNSGLAGGISPGGSLLAGTYTSHTAACNTTLTPWRRLFLSTTFSYQNARTVTAANGSTAVAPYEGGIYSVMASGSYVLNPKTDLTASYSLSTADFAQDNFAGGLPLGIKYQQQGVQIGIKRRIGKGKTFSLQYSFYHYDEPSSGGFNNFNAQAIFATMAFPLR
jgi:hypothetical protein